jgi:hypothetical protein
MNPNEARRYARVPGVLIAISLFAGGFGESFAPGKLIVAGDFHETSLRVAAFLGLFRAGFVAYMIEADCDHSLTAIFLPTAPPSQSYVVAHHSFLRRVWY